MFLVDFLKKIFKKEEKSTELIEANSIYENKTEIEEIHSVWDYLKFQENTQAFHIISVIGFEEWVSMEEILRRIKELFGMDYKNMRSLYPYIKTLVDCGIIETSNVGGKKRWRKKDILIKIKTKKQEEKEKKQEKARVN
ncbi:MAG: hypothetical protein COV47_00865 [Candidatus Diapherotrites archaeon CG11_big_fil_rev_8_21_14_0_20_37_9]|nr:MAG: hypothetical protein COV47_00865 [Candidatus Diapherotrites archaeon CG11_big_fil_rev_8_21_14_0_20_37_9]